VAIGYACGGAPHVTLAYRGSHGTRMEIARVSATGRFSSAATEGPTVDGVNSSVVARDKFITVP